jgi:hypothetical protein
MRAISPLVTTALLLALAACGGGGSGGSSPTASSSAVTVTPSLGRVWLGTFRLRNLQNALVAQGNNGTAESIALPVSTLPDGFIVELQGGGGARYFDEGVGAGRVLPESRRLHAVSATARGHITVTPVTEIIYQRALALAGSGALTATAIRQAEAEVSALFGTPASESWLDAPARVEHPAELPDGSTAAGRYARLLAALAQHALSTRLTLQPDCLADVDCTPLLDLVDDLAGDFADGALDGVANGVPLASPFYAAAGNATPVNLRAALQAAETDVETRVAALQDLPTTDRAIGEIMAGSYRLSCFRSLPLRPSTLSHIQLTIAPDGGFEAQGAFGTLRLPAGETHVSHQRTDGAWVLWRHGGNTPVVRQGSAALSSPVGDGLVIDITPDPVPAATWQPAWVEMNEHGSGYVRNGDDEWACFDFPSITALRSHAARLGSWLADGDYECEGSGPTDLHDVTISGGVAATSSQTWDLNTSLYGYEFQATPASGADTPDSGHSHGLDAVARTIAPLNVIFLYSNNGDALWVRRSLATGASYFDLTLQGNALQHCRQK